MAITMVMVSTVSTEGTAMEKNMDMVTGTGMAKTINNLIIL